MSKLEKPQPSYQPQPPVWQHRFRNWELAEKVYIAQALGSAEVQLIFAELKILNNTPLTTLLMQHAFRAEVLDELEHNAPATLMAETASVLRGGNAESLRARVSQPAPPPNPEEEEESDVYPPQRRS